MNLAVEACLREPPAATEVLSVDQWVREWSQAMAHPNPPVQQAIHGGFRADRLAWAFASGYQAALRAIAPGTGPDEILGFCMTEASGNRPRDVQTSLSADADGRVTIDGEKRWATMGTACTSLLVVSAAVSAAGSDRPALRVVRVPVGANGLSIEAMEPTRFVPEVPHAFVRLRGVVTDPSAVLPGDGWEVYGRPFRTLKDIHVSAATLAYLMREARQRAWPACFAERVTATLTALCALAVDSPKAPATHIALAGSLTWAQQLYAEAGVHWSAAADDPAAIRWQRDASLLGVASGARAKRTVRAWDRL